jgi:hypothetical protein
MNGDMEAPTQEQIELINSAIETFAGQIDALSELHGDEAVDNALNELIPKYEELTSGIEDLVSEGLGGALSKLGGKLGGGVTKAVTKPLGWAARKAKGGLKKITGAGAAGAAAVGGAAVTAGSNLVGKEWDQDVDIAAISTDDPLRVAPSREMQDILLSTVDAIDNMNQTLAATQKAVLNRLKLVDDSIDDSIAAETGETTSQVAARQRMSAARPDKPKKGPKQPETKKDKEEPTAVAS